MPAQRLSGILKNTLMYIGLIIFLLPFLLVILNSFKKTQYFIENPISWPKSFSFSNYIEAFDKMNFMQGFANTIFITLVSVVLIILFSAMAGYLFVRFDWKVNKILFFTMLAAMTVPFQVIMIPLVMIYGNLGLLDSKWVLTFMYMGFGIPLGVFMFHGFIKGISYELEESSFIDGCTRPRTFFQIVLPLLRPIIVTLAVLDVLWIWNDYLLPSLVLLSPDNRTLPLSTYAFFSSYSVDYGPLMAALVMTIIPVLILYIILQDHVIKGISEGAIK